MTAGVHIDNIRTDGGTQSRSALDPDAIADYGAAITNGAELPPPIVFEDSTQTYWLADGFHRVAALRKLGRQQIRCEIRQGSLREAKAFAFFEANATNGLRFTRADKRYRVETCLRDDEWSGWSDRVIAQKCGVSPDLVSTLRNELSLNDSSKPRLGADGKIRKLPERKPPKPPASMIEASLIEYDDTDAPPPRQWLTSENQDPAVRMNAPNGLLKLQTAWRQATETERSEFIDWLRERGAA